MKHAIISILLSICFCAALTAQKQILYLPTVNQTEILNAADVRWIYQTPSGCNVQVGGSGTRIINSTLSFSAIKDSLGRNFGQVTQRYATGGTINSRPALVSLRHVRNIITKSGVTTIQIVDPNQDYGVYETIAQLQNIVGFPVGDGSGVTGGGVITPDTIFVINDGGGTSPDTIYLDASSLADGNGIFGVPDTVPSGMVATIDSGITFQGLQPTTFFNVDMDQGLFGTDYTQSDDTLKLRFYDLGSDSWIVVDANGIDIHSDGPDKIFLDGAVRITDLITDPATKLVGTDNDGDLSSLVLGTNLSISNDTLNATGSSGGLTGTGIPTRIAAWTASGALGYDVSMVLDTVNNRMGVNTATPTTTLDVDGTISIFGGHQLAFKDTSTTQSLITYKGERFLHTRDNQATIGASAFNLFLGYQAGSLTNSGILKNTGVGRITGSSLTTGYNNLMFGDAAGYQLTSGYSNVLIGILAGGNNTRAHSNVFIGADAGLGAASSAPTTSVGIGINALKSVTSPASLVAIGQGSLTKNTSGIQNTAVGGQSGDGTTTGSNNTYIGRAAGFNVTTGGGNTYIGSLAGFAITTNNPSNVTVIYNDVTGTKAAGTIGNNTAILGWDQDVSIGQDLSPGARLKLVGGGATSATKALDVANSNDSTILLVRNDRRVGINTATPDVSLDAGDNTDGIKLPGGTTAQRAAVNNSIRYNSDVEGFEAREGGTWYRLTSSKTPAVTAGAGLGTGGTVSCVGNDLGGTVVFTTGTSAVAGDLFTLTFANAFDPAAQVTTTFSAKSTSAATAMTTMYIGVEGTTYFTLTSASALPDGTTHTINYKISQ
jgi:hypothetical protein